MMPVISTYSTSAIRPFHNTRAAWLILAILAATALLWSGALRVGFSTDDYLFIQQLAPIRTIADVFRPFWHADPNPPYWRPIANASAALDFLIWGWNGNGFHLSNFLFHLIATGLVFPICRRIFHFPVLAAATTTFFFGIAASHESNLLWPAARADTLTTIFMMVMLLTYEIYQKKANIIYYSLALVAYLFALLSKENGLLALPILIFLLELPEIIEKKANWKRFWIRMVPFFVVTIVFWVVRSHYTIPVEDAEPLLSKGSHSILIFLRNAIYGIGYAVLPLDLEQATSIIREQSIWLWTLLLLLLIAAGTFWGRLPRERRIVYWRPFVFFLIAGIVTMQSFERWRYYMPSIGLFALVALLGIDLWNRSKIGKTVIVLFSVLLVFFHVHRAMEAENNWEMAADEVQDLKSNLIDLLRDHPTRPLILNLLNVPGKLGSASVMLVTCAEFLHQAEAERLALPQLRYGIEPTTQVTVEKPVDMYALDPSEGFTHFTWQRLSDTSILLKAAPGTRLRFEPNLFKLNGLSRRDWKLRSNDAFNIGTNCVTILDADGSFAKSLKIDFPRPPIANGSEWLPCLFDGKQFRTFSDLPQAPVNVH